MQLIKGQNTDLSAFGNVVTATLLWPADGLDADCSALLLTAAGRVRDDTDLVFYNQPSSPDGSVVHIGKASAAGTLVSDRLQIDLEALPDEISTVVLAASVYAGTFQALIPFSLELTAAQDLATGSHPEAVRFVINQVSTETALLCAELYRRHDSWRLRAVGQGYADGLAGLARDFGITVEDDIANVPEVTDTSSRIDWTNPPVPAGYEL